MGEGKQYYVWCLQHSGLISSREAVHAVLTRGKKVGESCGKQRFCWKTCEKNNSRDEKKTNVRTAENQKRDQEVQVGKKSGRDRMRGGRAAERNREGEGR